MLKSPFLLLMFMAIISCKNEPKTTVPDAHLIIDKSMERAGSNLVSMSEIEFDFRNIHYKAIRNKGHFQLSRTIMRNDSIIYDVLNNADLNRYVNDSLIELSEVDIAKYSSSVNSVHYFSVLPFGLDDTAVNKRYIDSTMIKNQPYHIIEITFNEDGGGEDFEDVFLYWIHAQTFKIVYLAYKFFTEGGGMRFREAYNERFENGIRFVDYKNYKPETKLVTLRELQTLFESDNLELLSTIQLENLKVTLIDN
ncbi:DUF6503 family protein [Paucihalobacter sp.]|uniref:DUF6503 family protein n=1 Tax=Paucihalobacter sp. TaxID=2850405 RepID=UPI002FE08EE0